MRYFLFSGIVHLILVVTGLFVLSDTIDFQQAGDPSVSFTMVGDSTYSSGSSTNSINKPVTEELQEKEQEEIEEIKEKTVEETEIPNEEIIEDVVEEVTEKPLVTEEIIEVPIEEIPEEVIEAEEITEDINETIETVEVPSESSDSEVAETTENSTNKENTSENDQSDDTEESSEALGEGLVHLDDGSVAAKNQGVKGLEYGFLNQPEPNYPDIARRMGVNEDIIIKVRFLIGYDGKVEDIRYYDDVTNFGFRSEVEKALSSWRATPITVDGEPVKLYFYKSFKFEKL